MKKHLKQLCIAAAALTMAASCSKSGEDLTKNRAVLAGTALAAPTQTLTLDWDKTYQRIEGFGTFGGRITPFFESANRDTIMERLFGNSGLQLNIIRGKVLHTYPFDAQTGTVTIKPANVDITVDPASATYKALNDDQKEQLGQLWILKKVQERYKVPITIASCWTPPLYMKTSPRVDAKWFNGLNFNCCSSNFANYLAGFAKAYKDQGVNFYAISPTNEPENIISDWDASYWDSGHLGEFINNNLRPALNSKGLNTTKIIASENAAWGTANSFLSGINSSNTDIFAGHGYLEIADRIVSGSNPTYNQRPAPWSFSTAGKSVWMTEISDDNGVYNNTMTEGIAFATSMHKFMAECNVNAFIYWLGMLAIRNNEALICTAADGTLEYPKTYDVMGQYTRYVRPGYVRIDVAGNSSNVMLSAYKDPQTSNFSIVATNTTADTTVCHLQLKGFKAATLNSYLTATGASRWQQGIPQSANADGSIDVKVPPKSVITFTGTKQAQ
ncbi:MAG TPA: glycoside hydrolase [Chitinophaga sp.]|uniref:glycoside hydrolase n=1 Tax=Chitinophaga sp. TaxID=1869181 RepID=UPI002C980428|nr:glycoside hydrolase [Chitinophaga sp.]HVI44025.1 glycoside hydrolase [Chitinophaga sp.]